MGGRSNLQGGVRASGMAAVERVGDVLRVVVFDAPVLVRHGGRRGSDRIQQRAVVVAVAKKLVTWSRDVWERRGGPCNAWPA